MITKKIKKFGNGSHIYLTKTDIEIISRSLGSNIRRGDIVEVDIKRKI